MKKFHLQSLFVSIVKLTIEQVQTKGREPSQEVIAFVQEINYQSLNQDVQTQAKLMMHR